MKMKNNYIQVNKIFSPLKGFTTFQIRKKNKCLMRMKERFKQKLNELMKYYLVIFIFYNMFTKNINSKYLNPTYK